MARRYFFNQISYLNSIRSRLLLGAFGLVLLFLLALWAFRQTTLYTSQKLQESIQVYTPLQNDAQKVLVLLEQYKQKALELAYTADTSQRGRLWIRIEKIWNEDIQTYIEAIQKNNAKLNYKSLQDRYKNLIFRLEKHKRYTAKLQTQTLKGRYLIYSPAQNAQNAKRIYIHTNLVEDIVVHIAPYLEETRELIGECEQTIQILQVSQDFDDQNLNPFSSWFFWSFWLMGVFVCLWWLWQVKQMHAEDMDVIRAFPNVLLRGDLPTPVEPRLEEHKQLAHTLNALVRPLQELKLFAQDINKEQTQATTFKLFGNRGELGKALAQMREGLAKNTEENETRNIINTGLAKFADIFAKYTNNLAQLSEAFLANLINYIHANQGGLFLLETYEGKPVLGLQASFAYDQKRFLEHRVEVGQGLIGQVWKEGETTYLREVPQFYVNITSGLGEATPNALLIVPLKSSTGVLGVLEIASFHEILPYQREFVEKVAENLAQVIANSQQAEQTRYLLQESQALAHSLQAREEELKEKMSALQIAQHTMESTKEELEVKENNLQALINNTSHAIVAFDRTYRVTVINKSMRQLYLEQGVLLELGKNMLEEIPQNEFAKRHKDFFRVLAGEKFVSLERTERNGLPAYHELHYNPILNEEKDVLGASIFIENITQQKMAEVYLKETEANLNSLINNTKDAIMALDKDCHIVVVNDAYTRLFAERGYKIQRGKSLFEYLSSDRQQEWRGYCQRALAGEHFMKVIDTGKFPEKTYIEHWFNPIIEDSMVVGLSIFTRDITDTRRVEMQNKETLLESLEETQKLKENNRELETRIKEYERRIEDLQSSPK